MADAAEPSPAAPPTVEPAAASASAPAVIVDATARPTKTIRKTTTIRQTIVKSRIPAGGVLGTILYPFRLLKVIYAWVLTLADTKWGPVALCAIGIIDGGFFPIPGDPLLFALCIARRKNSFYYAIAFVVASATGALLGWLVGHYLFESVVVGLIQSVGWQDAWFGTLTHPETQKLTMEQLAALPRSQSGAITFYPDGLFFQTKKEFEQNAILFYLTAAVTPVPDSIAAISGGVFGISLPLLLMGCLGGRGFRFTATAALLYFYGPKIKPFIERYFEWIAFGMVAILVTIILFYRFVLKAG